LTGSVVREWFGAVLRRDFSDAGGVHGFLDHINEGVGCHVPLQFPCQDETRVVVHKSHEVMVAPAHNAEARGISGPHLLQ